jgi:hypothetical protein
MKKEKAPSATAFGCVGRLFVIVALLGVLSVVALILGWRIREASLHQTLQRRIADMEAVGEPFDMPSLQRYYESRTDTLHSSKWDNAIQTMTSPEFKQNSANVAFLGEVADISISGSWKEEQETREFITQWRTLREELQILTTSDPPTQINKKNANALSPTFDGIGHIRTAARFLNVHGKVAVRDRNSDGAFQAIESLLGLSTMICSDPLLVNSLVGMAAKSMAIFLIKDAIQTDLFDEAQLKGLIGLLQKHVDILPAWKETLLGEKAYGIAAMRNPGQSLNPIAQQSSFTMSRAQDTLYFMDYLDSLRGIDADDLDGFVASFQSLEETHRQRWTSNFFSQIQSIQSQQSGSTFAMSTSAFINDGMQMQIAILGSGIRLFQKKERRLPTTLKELVQVGIDPAMFRPVGGREYGYRLQGESGCILWGVSPRQVLAKTTAVPDEPPELNSEEPFADLNYLWRWEIK